MYPTMSKNTSHDDDDVVGEMMTKSSLFHKSSHSHTANNTNATTGASKNKHNRLHTRGLSIGGILLNSNTTINPTSSNNNNIVNTDDTTVDSTTDNSNQPRTP